MEPTEAIADAFSATVEHSLYFATTAERLVAAARSATHTAELLASVEDAEHAELAPEISAALTGLKDVLAAITRATETLTVKSEIRRAQIYETVMSAFSPNDEGSPS